MIRAGLLCACAVGRRSDPLEWTGGPPPARSHGAALGWQTASLRLEAETSVAAFLERLEAAAAGNYTRIVGEACEIERAEEAVEAFLLRRLDWRWDATAVYDDGGRLDDDATLCPRVAVAAQPPRLGAILRRFGAAQFGTPCETVVHVSKHSGTYLGNRVVGMARTFLHVAMKRPAAYLFQGLPDFLLDAAACGTNETREVDMQCYFLPMTDCPRPRDASGAAKTAIEVCRRPAAGLGREARSNWTCAPEPILTHDKRKGVPRFPRTGKADGHGASFFLRPAPRSGVRPSE